MHNKNVCNVFFSIFIALTIVSLSVLFFNFLFPLKYRKYINKYSNEFDIDRSLIASVIKVESRFDTGVVSYKGAVGLMQIMPSTAVMFISDSVAKIDDRTLKKPEINIKIGVSYLRYLFDKYDDEVTVLACYNAGEGVVQKWLDGGLYLEKSKIKYEETLNYVNKVQRLKKVYRYRFWLF